MPLLRSRLALAEEGISVARAIAAELAAVDVTDLADASLRGSSGAWLLVHELGPDAPPLPPAIVARWEAAAIAALGALEASFFDGMLGVAWLLARLGRAPDELAAVDAAVLELLHEPWDGGLAAFGGGLAGFGCYGLARRRTAAGRRIVRRCAALFGELAHRAGRDVWWTPGTASIPEALRHRVPPLLNREGSAAAIAFLAAAAPLARAALPLARRGAATLADRVGRPSHDLVGVAATNAAPGLVHGAGTWALGSAGALGALLAVGRATGDLTAAARCGRLFADLDPAGCAAADASLGTGTAGIACVMQALAEATRERVFAFAAEHWHRRTLRCRRPGEGIGGYLYCDDLVSETGEGNRWSPQRGVLEGAAGTALSLVCAARGARASPWLTRCLID